jgi:hypothetical protein
MMGACRARVHGTGKREQAGGSFRTAARRDGSSLFLFVLDTLAADGEGGVLVRTSMSFSSMPGLPSSDSMVLVFADVHQRCEVGGRQSLFWAFGLYDSRTSGYAILHEWPSRRGLTGQ